MSDAELGIVARLGADGTPQRALGRGLFKRPTGLALDAERGELYVADTAAHDIKVLDLAGNLKRVLGRRGEGDGEFNYPTHLAFADGELYVWTVEDAMRIAKLDALDPNERAVVEAVTRSVLNKLLHEPTVRLKDAAGTARGELYSDALGTLFDIRDAEE